jgi:HEAT repeat protein
MFGRPVLDILIFSVLALTGVAMLFTLGVLFLRSRNLSAARHWHEAEERWSDLLLDVLAQEAAPEELAARVAPNDRDRFIEFLAGYSRRLRGVERAILANLAVPFRARIERMMRARRPETRAHGVQVASVLGGEDAERMIAPSLDDPSPLVNMVAARALASRKSHGFLQTILVRSAHFEEVDLRYMSTMIAGVGTAASATLRNTLADENARPYARAVAADALMRMRDLESAGIAARVLERTTDTDIRIAALLLLGEVGHSAHCASVMSFLNADDAAVRGAAVTALGAIGDRDQIARIEQRLADESPWVRLRAAHAIKQLGGVAALRAAADRPDIDPVVADELRMMA